MTNRNPFGEATKYCYFNMHNHYIRGCSQITSLRYIEGLKITVL